MRVTAQRPCVLLSLYDMLNFEGIELVFYLFNLEIDNSLESLYFILKSLYFILVALSNYYFTTIRKEIIR